MKKTVFTRNTHVFSQIKKICEILYYYPLQGKYTYIQRLDCMNRELTRQVNGKHGIMEKSSEKLCKIVCQYSKGSICTEDMRKLQEIAEDYRKVKNYVYDRFGGIGSLSKLYPGYTVQNEMTASGFRKELGLPSVYFYLAVFEAIADIKSQWTHTKSKVLSLLGKNGNLTADEKHYLRYLLKVNNAFAAVLKEEPIILQSELQAKYDEVSKNIDTGKMHRYLCRQVRKYHIRLHSDKAEGFSASAKAYRYSDHGIYLAAKERWKRIFIELTDGNRYGSQIYIKLYPNEGNIHIHVPVNVTVRAHSDYVNKIGLAAGMNSMLTTDTGHRYGERLGEYQNEYSGWIKRQTASYHRNRKDNPGRKKYEAKKRRYTEQLHSYINCELNRLLRTEKPRIIYIVKLPRPQAAGDNRRVNGYVSMWQRGYVRKRLVQKCKEQSIELVEILGKGISGECSNCGREGKRKSGIFTCGFCGYTADEKENTARNTLKRGLAGQIIY